MQEFDTLFNKEFYPSISASAFSNHLQVPEFEVVVVGAGPAGAHCARLLAQLGHKVLLAEQHENFAQNNFSSAATPLETLQQFDLPQEVVASYWRKIAIATTQVRRSWESPDSLGVVFDFAKLRAFLASEVRAKGGEVWLGHRYVSYTQENGKTRVTFKQRGGESVVVNTQVLVDATGFSRAIIYPKKQERPSFLKGTGIEYLIEVEESEYQKYENSLIFFLGHQWIPKGYSWIFPMEKNQLKVGAAWLEGEHKIIREVKPLKEYIHLILQNYMHLDRYKILDIHGSILEYSIGLKDIYYRDNIIAIGDAVSTVNFLGGEGIRHGMKGAEIACHYIHDYLQGQISDFQAYPKEMYQYFAPRWNLSEQVSRRVYLEYSDRNIDRGVDYLKYLSTEDIIDILFYYKLEKFSKGFNSYLKRKIISILKLIEKSIFS